MENQGRSDEKIEKTESIVFFTIVGILFTIIMILMDCLGSRLGFSLLN